MKNKVFDRKLYLESLRQTRAIGLIAVILSCIVPVLVGVTGILSKTLQHSFSQGSIVADVLNLLELGFVLYLMIYLFAPMLAAKQFEFLNRRVSCDFYHAIPQTRLCLFLCKYAAVLTWSAAAIAACSLCCIALTSFASAYYFFNWASLLPTLLGVFAGCVLSSGAVILGITLTGTPLMNTIVTLMILFVPRILLTTWVSLLRENVTLLSSRHFLPLLSKPLNIVFSAPSGAVENPLAGIYSLVLGLLYAGLALLFFCRRRSEAAGASTPGRKLQIIFRSVFTLICCLPAITVICPLLLSGRDRFVYMLPVVIELYVVAIIAYFLFELITTRRAKNLLRAIPELLIVVAANVIIVGSVVLGAEITLSYTPAPEEIDSLTFELGNEYADSVAERYVFGSDRAIFINDPELKRTVSTSLAQNVSDMQKSGSYSMTPGNGNRIRMTVGIRRGDRTVYRNIYFTQSAHEQILDAVGTDPIVRERFSKLPALDQSVYLSGYNAPYEYTHAESVYEALRQAMLTADFTDNYQIMTNKSGGYSRITTFTLVATSGAEKVILEVPLLYCDAYESAVRLHMNECVRLTAPEAKIVLMMLDSGKQEKFSARLISKSVEDSYDSLPSRPADAAALAEYLRSETAMTSDSGDYLELSGYDEETGEYHECYFHISSADDVMRYLN